MKRILLEAVLVAIAGTALAFVANALSPRGLKLTRDYFPGATPGVAASAPGTNGTSTAAAHDPLSRLKQKGLQVVDGEQAVALFRDPRYEQGLIVFVDARNDEHYMQGHIPGAYQLDRMYPEKYLPAVLPACSAAQQIVVYCGGGDCELSEFTAEFLRSSAGVPNEKIFIYAGGTKDWESKGLPIETGERKSGQFRSASK